MSQPLWNYFVIFEQSIIFTYVKFENVMYAMKAFSSNDIYLFQIWAWKDIYRMWYSCHATVIDMWYCHVNDDRIK